MKDLKRVRRRGTPRRTNLIYYYTTRILGSYVSYSETVSGQNIQHLFKNGKFQNSNNQSYHPGASTYSRSIWEAATDTSTARKQRNSTHLSASSSAFQQYLSRKGWALMKQVLRWRFRSTQFTGDITDGGAGGETVRRWRKRAGGEERTQGDPEKQQGPPLVASISVLRSRLGRGNHGLLYGETPAGLKQFFREREPVGTSNQHSHRGDGVPVWWRVKLASIHHTNHLNPRLALTWANSSCRQSH